MIKNTSPNALIGKLVVISKFCTGSTTILSWAIPLFIVGVPILGTAFFFNLPRSVFVLTKSLFLKCFEHTNKVLTLSFSVKLQKSFHNLFKAGSRGNLKIEKLVFFMNKNNFLECFTYEMSNRLAHHEVLYYYNNNSVCNKF